MSELDILEEHADLVNENDDDTELVKRLRGELRKTSKRAKDRDTLFEENRSLRTTGLLSEAGLNDLKPAQKETLTEWLARQEQADAESLRARAVDLGWAEPPEDPADSEIDAQEHIAAAQRGGGAASAEGITAATYGGWDQQRRRAFLQKYPEAAEALKRGETVKGISF